MLAVVCVWQVGELALSRNGEATTEPLAGAETVMSAAYAFVEILEMKMTEKTMNADVRRLSNFMGLLLIRGNGWKGGTYDKF
jgi:hypothetical protein